MIDFAAGIRQEFINRRRRESRQFIRDAIAFAFLLAVLSAPSFGQGMKFEVLKPGQSVKVSQSKCEKGERIEWFQRSKIKNAEIGSYIRLTERIGESRVGMYRVVYIREHRESDGGYTVQLVAVCVK